MSWAVLGWNASDTTHGHRFPGPRQEGSAGSPRAATSGGSRSSGLRGARCLPAPRCFFHRVQSLCLRSVFPLNPAALRSDVPISSVLQLPGDTDEFKVGYHIPGFPQQSPQQSGTPGRSEPRQARIRLRGAGSFFITLFPCQRVTASKELLTRTHT